MREPGVPSVYLYVYVEVSICISIYIFAPMCVYLNICIYTNIYIYVKYVREWFNHPEIYEWENLPFFYICVAKRKHITYICNM